MSKEGGDESDSVHLKAVGYAVRWCDDKYLIDNSDADIDHLSIVLIATSKLVILFFCYEIYEKLQKGKFHKRTQLWYYFYWATQIAIIVGIGLLLKFLQDNQKNKKALLRFQISLGLDALLAIIFVISLHLYMLYLSCTQSSYTGSINSAPAKPNTMNSFLKLVSPPLTSIASFVYEKLRVYNKNRKAKNKTEQKDEEKEHLLKHNKHQSFKYWCKEKSIKILVNGISIFTFMAFLSYLTQAVPAISISYYINPTITLIRLGVFEPYIMIMVAEFAYVLFLVDKIYWIIYTIVEKKIPEEIIEKTTESIDSNPKKKEIRGSIKPLQTIIATPSRNETNQETKPAKFTEADKLELCGFVQKPQKGCRVIKHIDHYLLIKKYDVTREPEFKHPPELFVILTCLQIVAFFLVIYSSWKMLYFILNLTIEQTDLTDDFKDILAILPTIAINLFFLYKRRDIAHFAKDVVDDALEVVAD